MLRNHWLLNLRWSWNWANFWQNIFGGDKLFSKYFGRKFWSCVYWPSFLKRKMKSFKVKGLYLNLVKQVTGILSSLRKEKFLPLPLVLISNFIIFDLFTLNVLLCYNEEEIAEIVYILTYSGQLSMFWTCFENFPLINNINLLLYIFWFYLFHLFSSIHLYFYVFAFSLSHFIFCFTYHNSCYCCFNDILTFKLFPYWKQYGMFGVSLFSFCLIRISIL